MPQYIFGQKKATAGIVIGAMVGYRYHDLRRVEGEHYTDRRSRGSLDFFPFERIETAFSSPKKESPKHVASHLHVGRVVFECSTSSTEHTVGGEGDHCV